MDGEAVIPYPHYRFDNLQVETSVFVHSPKKDGGCKLCLGHIPPCPDRDGGGGNGAAPSPAEAWDGGAVCTPSSANGDGGDLDMLGN